MSYCRFGEADIYLFQTTDHNICCCGCPLVPGGAFLKTPQDALDHVKLHREHGDYVPQEVDEQLLREISEAKE